MQVKSFFIDNFIISEVQLQPSDKTKKVSAMKTDNPKNQGNLLHTRYFIAASSMGLMFTLPVKCSTADGEYRTKNGKVSLGCRVTSINFTPTADGDEQFASCRRKNATVIPQLSHQSIKNCYKLIIFVLFLLIISLLFYFTN